MKIMKTLKFKIIYILVFFLTMLTISCKEEDETEVTLSRLFRPVAFEADINANEVTFYWTAIGDGVYLLEISRDSFLYITDIQVFTVKDSMTKTVSNLWSQTRYSARVKAISQNSDVEDSKYKETTFITGTENIFYTVENENIGINTVLLKWNNEKNVSHIVVSTEGVDDIFVTLSSLEKSAGEKLIEGLNASTAYTFKIYLGEMLRGTVLITTKV